MIISTEQISKYHPDKYADQISDAIVTECLKQDKHSHCGVETMVKDTTVVLGGEITSTAKINYKEIVKRVAAKLGYNVTKIINLIGRQSPQIKNAVDSVEDFGAGDQGIMFGYACNETKSKLPFAFDLANTIILLLEHDVENNPLSILKGDAKCQVSYDTDKHCVTEILISVCTKQKNEMPIIFTNKDVTINSVRTYVYNLLSFYLPYEKEIYNINPSGIWTIGGPIADCGLTGRKIVCDQYGGFCAVGGGAFSGKDPTKVDRSAAYMARKIACDLVDKYCLNWCKVSLGYAIGVSHPMSVSVENDLNLNLTEEVKKNYPLTPKGIIDCLNLYEIDYEKLSEGCHYRNGNV